MSNWTLKFKYFFNYDRKIKDFSQSKSKKHQEQRTDGETSDREGRKTPRRKKNVRNLARIAEL